MEGLCPACRKVIESGNRVCPHCGTVIKSSSFPAEIRAVATKKAMKAYPGLYWGQTIVGAIGAMLLLFVNIWIGLIVIAGGFCFVPAWSRALVRTAAEEMYRGLDEEKKRKINQKEIHHNDYTDELKKLKELLDKGILTQEEFDKKKKELLKL